MHKWSAAYMAECISTYILKYEREHEQPRDLGEVAPWILAFDFVTIGLGWLIVWGCVAAVRWIRRGFATN